MEAIDFIVPMLIGVIWLLSINDEVKSNRSRIARLEKMMDNKEDK